MGHLTIVHYVSLLANIAHASKREVVVSTLFAYPVTRSLMSWAFCNELWLGFISLGWFTVNLFIFLVLYHMLWLPFAVVVRLLFLASEAVLSSLEVIVLALAAFPAAFREIEGLSLLFFWAISINVLISGFWLLQTILFWFLAAWHWETELHWLIILVAHLRLAGHLVEGVLRLESLDLWL